MKALIYDLIYAFTHPWTWTRNYQFDVEWDDYFNDLMRNHKFKFHDLYVASLGDVLIYTTSHPYASFRPFSKDHPRPMPILPSRRTSARAYKKLKADVSFEDFQLLH